MTKRLQATTSWTPSMQQIMASPPTSDTVFKTSKPETTHNTTVKKSGVTVANVYKPPTQTWPSPALPQYNHPAVYIRDFNIYHTEWGCRENDVAGERLTDWVSTADLNLLFDPKQPKTFQSGRWQTKGMDIAEENGCRIKHYCCHPKSFP